MNRGQMRALCQRLQAMWEELARLENDENQSRPGAPASPEDIARLREAFPALPEHYLTFLEIHDGWSRYWHGDMLFSVAETLGPGRKRVEHILEIETEDNPSLGEVIVIGDSENDARLVFIDPSGGAVVEHFHEDLARHDTFADYLQSMADQLRRVVEETRAKLRLLEQGKSVEFRIANEREAIVRAATQLRCALPPGPAVSPRLDCVPAYVRRVRWTDEPPLLKADGACVRLALNFYLAYNPTSDEMREALRLWRRHFPWDGKVSAAPFGMFPFPGELDAPADESGWAPFLSEQAGRDMYGLIWVEHTGDAREEAPGVRCFSVRAFSYLNDIEGNALPAASLCQAILPMDADPEPLIGFAQDLARVLPVRSGLAGLQARWSEPRGMGACYDWCRRFHGLDLQDSNHVYPALREGVRGANWLTILGRGLSRAFVETRGVPRFDEPQIQVLRDDACMIFRAGARPTLGDIARGEAPALYAAVERHILPLKIGTPDDAQRVRVFTRFDVEDTRYGPWLYRLIDPDRFLEHSARELSQLLQAAAREGTPEEIDDLAARFRSLT